MHLNEKEIEFLNKLSQAGITFLLNINDGWAAVDVEGVDKYLENPDEFVAERNGVTVEKLRQWREHVRNPQYPATTRKGLPCKGYVETARKPSEYVTGYSDYCVVHKEYA